MFYFHQKIPFCRQNFIENVSTSYISLQHWHFPCFISSPETYILYQHFTYQMNLVFSSSNKYCPFQNALVEFWNISIEMFAHTGLISFTMEDLYLSLKYFSIFPIFYAQEVHPTLSTDEVELSLSARNKHTEKLIILGIN